MAQIDFYLLAHDDLTGQMLFCARLCEKAMNQEHRVHVYTGNAMETRALDETLWSFRDDAFVPHRCVDDAATVPEPVTLSAETARSAHADMLILTRPALPEHWQPYRRVALLIGPDERLLQASRQLYRQLQQPEHTLNIHDLRRKQASP
jgi:DNA polymerase-3 subunit chi